MVIFKSIIAWCEKGGIGLRGSIPWTLKSDLRRFAKLTRGDGNNAVLMGRKTWESLPYKPLKYRHNIIISTTLKKVPDNCSVFNSLNDAVSFCGNNTFKDVWIIGGSSIYDEAARTLPLEEIYVTEITKDYRCDTFVGGDFVNLLSKMKITECQTIYGEDKEYVKLGNYVTYVKED
tara:strand:+ start:2512 stop:3039 length:528 start_codon:yes stop_codon:yes gene_type:complete